MRHSFDKLLWGFLLVSLNFKVNGFDVFPDFVGYGLIAWGAGELSTKSRNFDSVRAIAGGLSVFAFIAIFMNLEAIGAIIGSVINTLLIWYLLKGIAEIAQQRGQRKIADSAEKLRISFTIISMVLVVVILWGLQAPLLMLFYVAIIPAIIAFVLLIAVMFFIWHARNILARR